MIAVVSYMDIGYALLEASQLGKVKSIVFYILKKLLGAQQLVC